MVKKTRTKIFLICVAGCAVICALLVLNVCVFGVQTYAYFKYRMALPQYNGIEISGTPVDNDYNNYRAGAELVRIGDTLYYYYIKDYYSHGLIEITSDKATRVFYEGLLYWGPYPLNYPIRNYNGTLLLSEHFYSSMDLQQYSASENAFVKFEGINGIEIQTANYQQQGDLLVQTVDDKETPSTENDCYWYYQGEQGQLSDGDRDFYIAGDYVYYLAYERQDELDWVEMRKFDIKAQTETMLWRFDEAIITHFLVEDEYIIVNCYANGECALYILDCSTSEITYEVLNDFQDLWRANVYNGIVYVPSEKGLGCYDLKTKKQWMLYTDAPIGSCYIVDDTWIYFRQSDTAGNADPALYRIKQDGTCFEKVYG